MVVGATDGARATPVEGAVVVFLAGVEFPSWNSVSEGSVGISSLTA